MLTRAALVLVAALAIGALIGRVLPSLLIGIVLAAAVSSALSAALPHWVESAELRPSESIFSGSGRGIPLTTGHAYRAPDGTPMSSEEGEALHQAVFEQYGPEPDPALLPQDVWFGVAASRYQDVLVRESAALGAATVLVGGLAVVIVRRRRPE